MKYLQVLTIFLTIFLVRFTTIEGNGEFVDYRFTEYLNKERVTDPNEICKNVASDGLACSDCYKVVQCKKNPEGEWTVLSLGPCPQGKVCKKGHCVKSNRCPFPDLNFACSTVGIFPDPGDCAKYHFCVPNNDVVQHFPAICENNVGTLKYGYNPVTTYCSDKISNNECDKFYVPACKYNFEFGVIPNNPTIYYECRNYTDENGLLTDFIYPYQKTCQNGKKFSLATESCPQN